MRPYIRSRKDGKDWHPGGKDLRYRLEPQLSLHGAQKERQSFILSFYLTISHPNDEIFVASCLPYSLTFLKKQLTLYR